MIAESIMPSRRLTTQERIPEPITSSTCLPEVPAVSLDKLLWLGTYLRAKKESSGTWVLSEMGWLMENTAHTLAEIINGVSSHFFRVMSSTNLASVSINHAPLLNIDTIQSKLTASSVSVELECNYENTITGTRYDIDQVLPLLLYAAPQLCEQENVRQKFTLIDYWSVPLLQITHPTTDIPPEIFDYLFTCKTGNSSYRSPETLTRLELAVRQCSVTYNLDAANRDSSIALSILSRISVNTIDGAVPDNSFLPLIASLQWTINE